MCVRVTHNMARLRSSHSENVQFYRLQYYFQCLNMDGGTEMKMNCLRAANFMKRSVTRSIARESTCTNDNGYLPKLDFITVSSVAQD